MNRAFRIDTRGVRLAGSKPCEQFEHVVDLIRDPQMELAGPYGIHDVLPQHQVPAISGGEEYALRARKPLGSTKIEEPFGFFGNTADGLHLAVLVDRTGDGEILP